MNKKALLAIEIIWIILGILCLVITVREMIINGFGRAWIFLVMSVAPSPWRGYVTASEKIAKFAG